ncbi:EI24 domain-containing protein [Micromonospora sp. CPCC 206060]|uniref:EI24 domain-containing protein n=1 Tax=Micromonospora sp. CPCC 206060 TaxID=3122406 RepID=UPI002FEE72EE
MSPLEPEIPATAWREPTTADPFVPAAGPIPHQVAPPQASALQPVRPDGAALPGWQPVQPAEGTGREAVRRAGRAVATGAARTARTAAHRGTRPVVNFFAGIGCFWRGAGRFLTSPVLWLYAAAPIGLLVLAMLGITAAVEAGVEIVVHWLTSFVQSWPAVISEVLGGILLWGARIGVHIVLGYLVLPLSIVLGAPCYVLLARRVERTLGNAGTGGDPPSLWRACAVTIRQAVLVTLVLQLGWLLLVPLLLIPGLNLFVALGTVIVFNGFLVGLLILSIPLHHHGTTTFRAQLGTAWRHRASVIGFGAMGSLLLGLPVTPLRAVIAPMVFIGALLLHRRIRTIDGATAERAGGPPPGPVPPTPPALPAGPW